MDANEDKSSLRPYPGFGHGTLVFVHWVVQLINVVFSTLLWPLQIIEAFLLTDGTGPY